MYLVELVNRKFIARAMGLSEWDCRVTAIMREVRAEQLKIEEMERLSARHFDAPLLNTDEPLESADRRCKLTPDQASEMRHARETEKPRPSMRRLAKRFGLKSSSQVCKILHGLSWKP